MRLTEALSLNGLIAKLTDDENSEKAQNRATDEKMIKVE